MDGHDQHPEYPPAGWYGDVSSDGRQRWWDGSQWTQHFADQYRTTPAPSPEQSSSQGLAPPFVQSPVATPQQGFGGSLVNQQTADGPVLGMEPEVAAIFGQLRTRVQ
ncbi:MAG: DUF2510 domain-containing protein, partial [Thermoleophilaceae bacterium]|nr:DUF2510 domain-containing protein [Thermoleophilaceae bacterium]